MILDKNEYLSHVQRPEDIEDMRRVLDLIEQTINRHTINCTDFFDPGLVELAISILNRFPQIKYTVSGGFCNAENSIISIYPSYHYFEKEKDLGLRGIEITGNIDDMRHSDVLGSLLGLGIKRSKIGDIAFFDEKIKVAVHDDIYPTVLSMLSQIGREYVTVTGMSIDELGEINHGTTERSVIAGSMRLDALIGSVYNLSRSISKDLVDRGYVKLDYRIEERSHIEAEEEQLISVRRHGRFTVESIDGTTRSGRIHLTISEPE